jgi:hypothetical protein
MPINVLSTMLALNTNGVQSSLLAANSSATANNNNEIPHNHHNHYSNVNNDKSDEYSSTQQAEINRLNTLLQHQSNQLNNLLSQPSASAATAEKRLIHTEIRYNDSLRNINQQAKIITQLNKNVARPQIQLLI